MRRKDIGLQFLASGLSISHEIHPKPYKSKCFSKNSSVWWMQGGGYDLGFHEILGHSPSPAPPQTKEFLLKHLIYKVFHVKCCMKSCWISKLWAFASWSSIGLSKNERPKRTNLSIFAVELNLHSDRYCWVQTKEYHFINVVLIF